MQIKNVSKKVLGLTGACALFAATMTGVAEAQDQSGLVNVNIEDVTVQIPIVAAANICNVNVLVLAQELLLGGGPCKSGAISLAQSSGGSGGPVTQDGLVNVNLTNVDAQVPVTVAANICGVTAAVLTQYLANGPVDCKAFGKNAAVSQ